MTEPWAINRCFKRLCRLHLAPRRHYLSHPLRALTCPCRLGAGHGSMEALLGLVLYACGLLLLIFALLCGQNELFARTPLPRLHHLITQGLCDAAE